MPPFNEILEGNAEEELKELEGDSIDLIVTDPPYGYSFMGKEWDKAVVPVDTWRECLRVLKAGAFAFVMSAPRQDVLSRMICNLQDAGFRTDFTSIYWTYASGFPKAANVSKLVDKKPYKSIYTEIKYYLEDAIKKSGKSRNQIDDECGFTACRYSSFVGKEWGSNLPTKEKWDKMKSIIVLDNRYDDIIVQAEREIIETKRKARAEGQHSALPTLGAKTKYIDINYTKPATEQAKKLDGSYAGFQPKPAVEVILTVMKPLSEKSFVDQALSNGKGITWLDDCRIPFQNENDYNYTNRFLGEGNKGLQRYRENNERQGYDKLKKIPKPAEPANEKGRFPANLLVSDDSLNDGKITGAGITGSGTAFVTKGKVKFNGKDYNNGEIFTHKVTKKLGYNDKGSHSRYFDLDKWFSQIEAQFIITPKASPSERNKGLEGLPLVERGHMASDTGGGGGWKADRDKNPNLPRQNHHPTVKPLKLMSYLITLGSRENDIVLDPFCGSGTTLLAAHQNNRKWIGIDNNKEYVEIARKRIEPYLQQQKIINWNDSSI